jgi:hypothetical protein
MLLSYNVCKTKECRLSALLGITAVGSDTGRRVNGCRVMATEYLEVSERVQG